ncbi:E3 ubiquitin-protein ligase XIAP [Lepisosteus oculatus]|uniref:E3 ubiquitin-protein ligase XIAP n=1 Tax=Lepisosteus oculatus TaxID=7918 RepID=UPI00074027D0|nr:PREDICTED: E3 ubiquitin-protein ligase XIAP [Lepisosteus oculatus]
MASAQHDSDIESDNCVDMSAMKMRLRSFSNFPCIDVVSPQRLARAGFYFTGEADKVQCFSCNQTVENWRRGDAPVQRHHRVSPNCKYLCCTHLLPSQHAALSEFPRPSPDDSPDPSANGSYDEEAEDLEYRLRTGEIVDNSTYPRTPHMCREDDRLKTFEKWPSSVPVRPRQLAQAGLYYLDVQDRVQCFCCGGVLGGWEPQDEPWKEHERHFPNCFFILGHDVGNIPSELPPESANHSHTYMESFEDRLRSFASVPHPIDPERLARAGFYTEGVQDRVICFKCGGGLKDWQSDEEPWEEHAKYYPGCSFVLMEKGQQFVNSMQLRDHRRNFPDEDDENSLSVSEQESDVMLSEVAQRALEMGLDETQVKTKILEKIRTTGEGYKSVQLLVEDLLNEDVESDSEETPENDEDPMEKLRKLQREKQCKVCMDRDIAIVFIPCGHLVTCKRCSDSLSKCPICCAAIVQKVKTYIS